MLGAGPQFGRGHSDDRFYNAAKARRNPNQSFFRPRSLAASSAPVVGVKGKVVVLDGRVPENRAGSEPPCKTAAVSSSSSVPEVLPPCNLAQFIKFTSPSVPAQYPSKTRMREWKTELLPYFGLEDLWESFQEWSAYGAGVPLLLNGSDSVVQYYVPYLSGMQLYVELNRQRDSTRRQGEESDGDCCRDSSSDASSDCERERCLKYTVNSNQNHLGSASVIKMERLSLRDEHMVPQEEFSSDEGEAGNGPGHLLFEYFERSPPYSREPLADKISDLACRFSELKTLRSCDLLPTSWMSVAWYPIYRIPTGPTLRDLDACFLTFHLLSTQVKGVGSATGPSVSHPHGPNSAPKISLSTFGLSSYKFKGSIWTANFGYERQLSNSLLQKADTWLRNRQVDHPDYQFFASHGAIRR
ncbi:uncharacterized protein LOC120279971 [Dioscorea cayenensis subsp. rotundata]|uniref:Uncharacterized protein LOC120279971 n=1 Tax=Dioscorea cayennensis subsp. rotundata TaxID=55577 RepID=A0AB40CX34_DIOCR|nr:uncharacterized protein LOC120279971 [Dioscorea cayenensis subsp. rotundata]